MRTVDAALTAAVLTRNYAPAIGLACGAVTLDQTRIHRLEIHEIGRLGLANILIRLDNHDGGADAFIAAIGAAPFTSTDGVIAGGTTYTVARGTWWMTHITPSNPAGQSDFYTIEAQNAWSLLKAQPDTEAAYTSTPIGDLLEAAFVGAGGTAIGTDGAALFDTEIDFKFPAGWPFQPRVGDLAGYAENAQARVYGRFSADGATWQLFGGEVTPAAAGSVGDSGETRVLASFIGNRDCLNTIYINGNPYAAAADITALAGVVNARRGFLNARQLTTLAQVKARRLQEIIEQVESHITGEIETEYDPRWEQWDYLEVHNVPEVADGQIVRVSEVHLTYRAGYGYKQVLHVRAVCADASFTEPADIDLLPAITNLTGAFYMDDLIVGWDAVDEDAYPAFLHYEVLFDFVQYVTTDNTFTYTSSMNRYHHGGVYDPILSVTVRARSRYGPHGPDTTAEFTNDNPYGDTVQDDFALYGGAALAQQASAALHWIQLCSFEWIGSVLGTTIGYIYGPDANNYIDTSRSVQGLASAKLQWPDTFFISRAIDMSAENRFTADDYVGFACYTDDDTAAIDLRLSFQDGSGNGAYHTFANLPEGWNFLHIKRSDLTTDAGFDWSDVTDVTFFASSVAGKSVWLDDLRLVKARASDDQPWNDTGGKWKPITGTDAVWHIEQDLPDQPDAFCLAQLNTLSAERWINLLQGSYTLTRHFICGILLRDVDTKASLYCAAANYDDGYGVRLDHAAQNIKLDRYDGGSRTTLATAAFAFDTNEIVTVAFERVDAGGICIYAARSSAGILDARNLLISATDDTYPIGKIGVIAHGCNCRFYRVRAGSPEHARTAEYAFATDPTGHVHASGAAFAAATGTATRSTFDTTTVTTEQLAERVKALIDDLQADRLIGE